MLKPWLIAGLLSLLFPGLGQIYNRQTKKGFVVMLLQFVLILVGVATMGILGMPAIMLWIWGIIDALAYALKGDSKNTDQSFTTSDKSLYVELGIGVVIAIVLVFLVWNIGTGIYCKPHPSKKAVKEDALEYLTEKYEQEFEITRVKFNCYPYNTFEIKAYSLNNPDVTITMYAPSTGDEFSDDYLDQLWDKQVSEEIKPLVKKIYPKFSAFTGSIVITRSSYDLIGELRKYSKVPNYYQYKERILNAFPLKIRLALFIELNENNKPMEMKKIYYLIQTLKKNEMKNFNINAEYYDPKLEKKGRKVLEDVSHKFFDELQYSLNIKAEDIPSIQTPEDVTKYLKKIND
jgi:TM2 domain-containing membrane protein YozV